MSEIKDLEQAFFILEHGSAEGLSKYLKAIKMIKEQCVQVVSCKDCDNWDTEWKPIWGTERYCFALDHITDGNFFCAYGERKKQPKTETKTDHWGYERLLCPNCKAQYTKGQRYCDNCGQKLI